MVISRVDRCLRHCNIRELDSVPCQQNHCSAKSTVTNRLPIRDWDDRNKTLSVERFAGFPKRWDGTDDRSRHIKRQIIILLHQASSTSPIIAETAIDLPPTTSRTGSYTDTLAAASVSPKEQDPTVRFHTPTRLWIMWNSEWRRKQRRAQKPHRKMMRFQCLTFIDPLRSP
jgi:hypothetical protein